MSQKPNDAFEYAKKISDYFAMALRVGVGAGAAFALWELASADASTRLRNELIAGLIGFCTLYLALVFIVSVYYDLRSVDLGAPRKTGIWLDVLVPVVALALLVSLVYFARTTAKMMM
jgi:hypothetical protein